MRLSLYGHTTMLDDTTKHWCGKDILIDLYNLIALSCPPPPFSISNILSPKTLFDSLKLFVIKPSDFKNNPTCKLSQPFRLDSSNSLFIFCPYYIYCTSVQYVQYDKVNLIYWKRDEVIVPLEHYRPKIFIVWFSSSPYTVKKRKANIYFCAWRKVTFT